jgi:hypothetical protein
LNLIEQLRSVLKSSAKKEYVLKKGNLPKHIKVGTGNISDPAFNCSVKGFNDCLNIQLILKTKHLYDITNFHNFFLKVRPDFFRRYVMPMSNDNTL